MICFAICAAAAATIAATGGAAAPERRFEVGRFDAIRSIGSDNVRIVTGRPYSVTATGDPAAVASLAIDERGGTLRIGRTPGNHNDHGALVTVTMPKITAATLEGSGDVGVDIIRGDQFTATLSGSGNFRFSALNVRRTHLLLGGSGRIDAGGSTDRVYVTLRGSGDVDAQALTANDVDIDLTGSGNVTASATRHATINASGSGDVRVLGRPRCEVRGNAAAHVRCD